MYYLQGVHHYEELYSVIVADIGLQIMSNIFMITKLFNWSGIKRKGKLGCHVYIYISSRFWFKIYYFKKIN